MRFKEGDVLYHKGMVWRVLYKEGGYSIITTSTGRTWRTRNNKLRLANFNDYHEEVSSR